MTSEVDRAKDLSAPRMKWLKCSYSSPSFGDNVDR